MTVVNPKSISGITSITTASGSDNLLTIHTNDGTERVRVDSTGTTKIVTGIVTTLTATGSAKVGTGITLSPDGDIFTTGITSFTNDVQFVGDSGISSITYDKSANQLNFVDNAQARFGTDADLKIFHSGSHSHIRDAGTGSLLIQGSGVNIQNVTGTETMAQFTSDGAVQLFHDNIERFRTYNEGIQVLGTEGGNASILMKGDEGDDNNDTYRIICGDGSDLFFQSYATGSYVTGLKLKGDGNGTVELNHSGTTRLETTGAGISVTQSSGGFSDFHHGGSNSGIRIAGPAGSSGANLVFANNFDNSVSDEWAIQLQGSTDDLLFKEGGHSGNERVRILETGGITFGGDTATANALDDYEKGTWTISINPGGGSYSVSHMQASYIKVGDVVHIQGWWRCGGTNSISGSLGLFGLPFTTLNNTGSGGLRQQLNLTVAHLGSYSSGVDIHLRLADNGTSASFYAVEGLDQGWDTLTAGNVSNTTAIYINGSYIAA